MEMSSFEASTPGANATISIDSSVVSIFVGGNVPDRLERRLEGDHSAPASAGDSRAELRARA